MNIKIKQAKRVILILLATLLSSFCMVTLVGAISLVKNNPPQKEVEAAETVTSISSLDDLNRFAKSVADGNNYSGVTVTLKKDISGGTFTPIGYNANGQIRGFKGVFDGDGYNINNLSATCSTTIYGGGGIFVALGFFCVLEDGAQVKNLSISNFHLIKNEKDTGMSYTNYYGGIAGAFYGNGSANITNCQIKNFQITKTGDLLTENNYIGGIVGGNLQVGTLNITDCLVSSLNLQFSKYGVVYVSGVGSSYNNSSGSTKINKCIYNKNSTIISISKATVVQYDIALKSSTITNCRTSAGEPANFNWDATSNPYSSTWYYKSDYNEGWPTLRKFMRWTQLETKTEDEAKGKISETINSYLRDDETLTQNISDNILKITGKIIGTKTITANENKGYEFDKWDCEDEDITSGNPINRKITFTAKFIEKTTCLLTFANATGVKSGETIKPFSAGGTSYSVINNQSISVTNTISNGSLILVYSFKNSSGSDCIVSYTIPIKYELITANNPESITTDTTIIPEVELKTFEVTFESATGSSVNIPSYTVVYGSEITYNPNNISFTCGNSTATYTPNAGYKFERLEITNTETGSVLSTNSLSSVTQHITIKPVFARWYTVTFNKISNTTAPTSAQTIEVKENDSITETLSNNDKTLTYSYNNQSVVYTASQYYRMSNGTNELKITSSHPKTITPQAIFYACTVTIGAIDSNIVTRTITDDNYGAVNDGIFIVEFGTTVTFSYSQSGGIFTYTYTFSSGQVVTYTMKSNLYAMQYTLNAQGDRTSIYNGLNNSLTENMYTFETGVTSKTISPTFGLKQYGGNLA